MKSTRIAALDGLRGIAILTVIFTHVSNSQIHAVTPAFLQPVLSILFGNGGVGVAILFILTGFLMASIYPHPNSTVSFWGKRFARLLPPFLVMVASLSIIRFNPSLSPLRQIEIVLVMVLIARALWELCVLLNRKIPLGKILTIGWVCFQAIMALWYLFVLLRVPSSVFFLVWTPVERAIATTLVNASLTLPFGQYIGQLDGVYWSLVTEMFFYLIYPFIFVPILNYSKQFSLKLKTALLLTALPACFGLGIIAKRLLGFEIMSIQLMIYFIGGTVIGLNIEWFQTQILNYRRIFLHSFTTILLLLIVFYSRRFLFPFFTHFYTPVVSVLSVFPIGLLLIMTTMKESKLSHWLSHPLLTYLGKISFSLYLTHAFIIDIMEMYIPTQSASSEWLLISAILIGSIIFSTITYHLIEKPYYDLKKIKKSVDLVKTEIGKKHYVAGIGLATLIIIIGMYSALRSPVSLFSKADAVGNPSFSTLMSGEVPEEITTSPYAVTFAGTENNLGMITTHLRSVSRDQGGDYPSTPPQLVISLYDAVGQQIASSNYTSADIYEDTNHPFGFPVISDSKNNTYTVTYQMSQLDPTKKLVIVNTGTVIKPVYLFNKANLVHQPVQLIQFGITKIFEPITLPMFWFITLYVFPFIGLLWMGLIKPKVKYLP